MIQPTMLWNNQYAPLTWSIGFLNLPVAKAAVALSERNKRIHGSVAVQFHESGLPECFSLLEPLTFGGRPRELVVGTANPDWTAFFDCGIHGGDQASTVGPLARDYKADAVLVRWVSEEPGAGTPGGFGARQLQLIGPAGKPPLMYIRTLAAIQDDGEWEFHQGGTMQPFEDPSAYSRRPLKERLTPQMLIDYCAALGLAPFDDDFYPGPSTLVTNPQTWAGINLPRTGKPKPVMPDPMTLEQVRNWRGASSERPN